MKTATYLRYSSDNQKETSIHDQLRNVENHCEKMGWPKPIVFKDEAISGSRNDRPGYLAMRHAAANKQFDVLVVNDLSRLSRDQVETMLCARFLLFYNVRLIGATDGLDSDRESFKMEVAFHGMMHESFLDKLAKDVHRGLSGLALNGYSPGVYPYGYASMNDGHGFKRVIDEEKAQWVRFIFAQYAEGVSPRQIVAELNRQGVKGPTGGKWVPCTIQAKKGKTGQVGMLGNPAYIGQHTWNKTKKTKNPVTDKFVTITRPEDEWVTLTMPDLRIVDEATWEKCQARIARNIEVYKARESKHSGGRTAKYLFSGLLRCGVCGAPYVMKSDIYYGCSKSVSHNGHACSNRRAVRRSTLEQTLLEGIKRELLSEEMFAKFEQETQELLAQEKPDPAPIKKRITEAEKELKNLMAAIKAGILTATTKAEVEATEQTIATAQNELQALESFEPAKVLQHARETYRTLVLTLENATNIHETREALRKLVGSVILRPDEATEKGLVAEFTNTVFASALSVTHLSGPYQMRCLQRPATTISLSDRRVPC